MQQTTNPPFPTPFLSPSDNAAFLGVLAKDAANSFAARKPVLIEAISDPFHLAKSARNAAMNSIIRTLFGAWSMYHGHVVWSSDPALLPGWRQDDGRPIDKHDASTILRIALAVLGDAGQRLSTVFIVATIEVSASWFNDNHLSKVSVMKTRPLMIFGSSFPYSATTLELTQAG
jgi:hypothetical protein